MRLPDELVERAAKAIDNEIGLELREHLGHIMRKWPNTITELAEAALEAALSEGGEVQVVTKRELVLEADDDGTPTKVSQVLSPLWPRKGAGRYLVIPLSGETTRNDNQVTGREEK